MRQTEVQLRPVLIVGAGLTGAVLAERISSQLSRRVLVIDQRPHFGGNAYDIKDNAGVLIHPYGPHIFHTNSVKVVEYLSRFTAWRPYEHRVLAMLDEGFVPLPFNFTTMELLFGEVGGARLNKILTDEYGAGSNVPILKMREASSAEIRKLSDVIYEKIFLNYTRKQWGGEPTELDAAVSARVPVRLSRDDRYFQDTFQQMPADGFAAMVGSILDHPLIEVRTGVKFSDVVDEAFDHVVFTGPIDEFFGYRHGPLPYRSLNFEWKTEYADTPIQPAAVINFPSPASVHPYTRCTEYRLLTGQKDISKTTRSYEYALPYQHGLNEPFYPVPKPESRELFRRYDADARKLKTVTFAGRLGDYQYYNMDQAVARALSCFENEIVPNWRHV